jgi:hypothetical protein
VISCEAMTAVGLPPPLRGTVGERGGRESPSRQWARRSLHWVFGALLALPSGSAHSNDDEVRWRVFDQDDTALLVIADSDETDNFGSPLFQCKKASGIATAEGYMSDDLRHTAAEFILQNREFAVNLMPDDSSVQNVEVFYSDMTGWRYRFQLSVTGPAFEQLNRAGSFQFKIDETFVRDEFKVGLENVAKFQELCKRPSK